MRKGEKTRTHIIIKSAELFNQKGYAGSTIQDIMDETGLSKGGVYRNFANKDEIAVEAFEYAGKVLWSHVSAAVEGEGSATERILAMCDVYRDAVNNPPLKGGCPLLNTAVESDHSYPVLRDRAFEAYRQMSGFIKGILEEGITNDEFRKDMDTESIASFIFSAMEGSVMSSRLTLDNKHVAYTMQNIKLLLQTFTPQKVKGI
jgi:TetR/AcrR family transcriptional repressor of nem operon